MKAPRPGNVVAELIKHGFNDLFEPLTKLFESRINNGDLSEEWDLSFHTSIHKKGLKEKLRDITVTDKFS